MTKQHDEQMEKEIVELGLTAPRVTLDSIKALMAKVEYKVHVVEGTTTTHAVALLDGFSLAIGMSSCVDPANFNEELGRKYSIIDAEEKAQKKLWELEGYRLKFSPLGHTIQSIGSFGWAVERMKSGAKVARCGWNGSGMFAYYVPANSYPAERGANVHGIFKDDLVPYRHYLALKTAQDDVATWSPSTSDALATDWEEVE